MCDIGFGVFFVDFIVVVKSFDFVKFYEVIVW